MNLLAGKSIATPRCAADSDLAARSMRFLQYSDARFRRGLAQHGILDVATGYRLLNTSLGTDQSFGERWHADADLQRARASGQPYYFDRIVGGMPYPDLTGMEDVANALKDDPNFLGFQIHEWAHGPIHDRTKISKWFTDTGTPFDAEHFEPYRRRTEMPYLSCGDDTVYRDILRSLRSCTDVRSYLRDYLTHMLGRVCNMGVAVNGYWQFYHLALQCGSRHVMAEIGNQVPLTALQIAAVRGAARQYGRPFGVYYEPWGGEPSGCLCELGRSPWYGSQGQIDNRELGFSYGIGPSFGSSRSLQRRLLYYAWLSGANYICEEWGPENYFSNWDDFPLTEYGRVVQHFVQITRPVGRVEPVVPAAIVLPDEVAGLDNLYLSGHRDDCFKTVPADAFHHLFRPFCKQLLGACEPVGGRDAHNLTSSPWIGCFDVLAADAPASLLGRYDLLVYTDAKQAAASAADPQRVVFWRDEPGDVSEIQQRLGDLMPFGVDGEVGAAIARAEGRYLVGLFNNRGVIKTTAGETTDPNATCDARLTGQLCDLHVLVGSQWLDEFTPAHVDVRLPAGELVVFSIAGA